jgi:16S rRNA (cytosine1402-N4)-methyltransferase
MQFNEGHVPVLLDEFLSQFEVLSEGAGRGGRDSFIDFTFGLGGHSIPLLDRYAWLKIIAFDADPEVCRMTESKYAGYTETGRLTIINSNFIEFDSLISPERLNGVFGALADFGISNYQLFEKGRGFSFDDKESLDMRINPESHDMPADVAVNGFSAESLADIFYSLADERLSRQIARAIVEARTVKKIESCNELAEIVRKVYKRHPEIKTGVDFATKTIMALRIFVNSEFENIKTLLQKASSSFCRNSWLFTITFHSNEDRIVKDFIKTESRGCICPIEILVCRCGHKASVKPVNRKPIGAGNDELRNNPRSRSAKMRVIEFI